MIFAILLLCCEMIARKCLVVNDFNFWLCKSLHCMYINQTNLNNTYEASIVNVGCEISR